MNNNKKPRIFSQEDHVYKQILHKTKDNKQLRLIRAPSLQ